VIAGISESTSSTVVSLDGYKAILGLRETEKAIKLVKDFFQTELARELCLSRVSAPMFVRAGMGINDDLTGVEKPVSFEAKGNGGKLEIVQALTKWKRMALADYGFEIGEGLYTDMNAIRPDETLSSLHSIYIDQWDWEKIITKEQRTRDFLKKTFGKIYKAMRATEKMVHQHYPEIKPILPEEMTFIHAEDLQERYPDLSPSEREDAITKEKGVVFIIGIGHDLKDGKPHDGRAPDYDDWSTPTVDDKKGLNGDIIVWHPVLEKALEITSGGIRVDREALLRQLEIQGCEERKELLYHQKVLSEEVPFTIGSGIGQSRLCMFFLRKAHIGEVQSSVWPDKMIRECKEAGIQLL